MLNLFVESRFQLFNMKALFDFTSRISAGMIDNFKTRNITLRSRSTKMFKNFVPKEMLINNLCVKMRIGFTNITSSTALSASKGCRDKCDISCFKIIDHILYIYHG